MFNCLCDVKDISTDMVSVGMDPDLNKEDDIRTEDSREDKWTDVAEDVEDKSNIHSMR